MALACCQICKKSYPIHEVIAPSQLRPHLIKTARDIFQDFNLDDVICLNDLRKLRDLRIGKMVDQLKNVDESIRQKVLESITQQTLVTQNIDDKIYEGRHFGDRAADAMAKFGGSWLFIGIFVSMIAVWMVSNTVTHGAFDPFPFIFLNLFLSCIAAFQAPVIMMSQNRQTAKDRLRDIEDYRVNLKAELEIQQLHVKMDQLMQHQWEQLIEIQKLQLEVAEDLIDLAASIKAEVTISRGPDKDRI